MTEQAACRLRQCVILVGGMATRLGALAETIPKPVLPVGDRPFLAWLLRELSRYGIEEAVLLCGHLSGPLRDTAITLAARLPRPMRLVFSEEPIRAGTGGALFHARHLLDDRFLLCNGDSLFDANLALLLSAAADDAPGVVARLLLHTVPDASRYGVVSTSGDRVTGFAERASGPGPADINAGILVARCSLIDHLAETGSLERHVLPKLAASGHLCAQRGRGAFIDIGIPADLARARAELPARLQRRALFLDRDGVINRDHGYVGSIDRFDFTDTARAAIACATEAGWHVMVVTNQSGIARGRYTEAEMHALHAWMGEQVLRAGGTIDDIRHCPFHPEATIPAYARASDWRKPAPGMLLDLIRAWELDPSGCVMVGDQPTDLQAAAAAGVPGYLFPGGDLAAFTAPLLGLAP